MAWWGIGLVLGPNINLPIDPEKHRAAHDAVLKARSLARNASEAERSYIEALGRRYSIEPDADRAALDRSYAGAMRDLSRRYPDDLDAATLFAESLMDLRPWALWTHDGQPAEGTSEILALLESVLRRDPNHPGANHYYIHAVESSPHPERALASAGRLEKLVPGAGHLVHMPSHIYMRTGDYEAAAELIPNVGPGLDTMPMCEFFMPWPLYVSLRFQKWDDVLAEPRPAARFVALNAIRRFARGVAFAAKRDLPRAKTEKAAFDLIAPTVAADVQFSLNSAASLMKVAGPLLEARMAQSEGHRAEAIASFRRAVEVQDTLAYDEPPGWYYPIRESLGAALFLDGRYEEAERIFRADLERNPRNGRSLFGIAKCLEALGRHQDASWVGAQFEQAWKNAEVTLRMEDF